MDPKALYQERLTTPLRAAARIKSGQRVFVGSNCAEPTVLVEALVGRADRLADTEIVQILTLGVAPYAAPRFQDHFRTNAFFIGPNVRDAVNECRADYTPIFLSELPELFRRRQLPIDYALIQVTPPDKNGFCSFGVSVDIVKAAAESARHIIAEVNPKMPRTLGESFIHVSRIEAFVESDRDILEPPAAQADDVAHRIGRYIADLIEDGSTLQMGIGSIPDAVLASLTDKQDLGVHSEMISDGTMALAKAGVITNRRKSIHPGKMIVSFCMGSRELYDFVDNNPGIEFWPTEYVNDPFVVAQNERMVSINSAIEVDLTGQVCADSIGEYFYSGIGGQVDFVRGAARSLRGKPIIALPSTAPNHGDQPISRIVADLKTGAGVVTSRGDVHYIVTEWGVAYLHGKPMRERALALARIAHPDFRGDLVNAAKQRKLVMPFQSERGLLPVYPEELESWSDDADGTPVLVRPIQPTDDTILREFHYQLSEETISRRYRRVLKSLPMRERQKLVNIDYDLEMAFVVVRTDGPRQEIVAEGRYYVDEQTRIAEVAFVVRDDWQEKGYGTLLMRKLMEVGRAKDLAGFEAYVQADNTRMIGLLLSHGFTMSEQMQEGTCHFLIEFGPTPVLKTTD